MKILFGTQDLDTSDTSGTLTSATSGQFYYAVEYGSNSAGFEEFVIMDGCGRIVPIDIDNLDNLYLALDIIKEIVTLRKKLEMEVEDSVVALKFVTESVAKTNSEICL